jgi:hypothetical protein
VKLKPSPFIIDKVWWWRYGFNFSRPNVFRSAFSQVCVRWYSVRRGLRKTDGKIIIQFQFLQSSMLIPQSTSQSSSHESTRNPSCLLRQLSSVKSTCSEKKTLAGAMGNLDTFCCDWTALRVSFLPCGGDLPSLHAWRTSHIHDGNYMGHYMSDHRS